MRTGRRWAGCAVAAAGVAWAAPAFADDFTWVLDGGGTFQSARSWSGPADVAPGSSDRGIFALDATYSVWLNYQVENADVGQVRIEAGELEFRVITTAPRFRMIGSTPLEPGLQLTAAESALTRMRLTGLGGTLLTRRIEAGEIVLGSFDEAVTGTTVLEVFGGGVAESANLHLVVDRGVSLGVGAGTAEIEIGVGGVLAAAEMNIAVGDTSASGMLVVDDGMVEINGLLRAGATGQGLIDISNGGELECGAIQLGGLAESHGELQVHGASSRVQVTADCVIGHAGSGRVTVSDGARFTSLAPVYVGLEADGAIDVSGEGSEFLVLHDVWLGLGGTGQLSARDGGRYQIAGRCRR